MTKSLAYVLLLVDFCLLITSTEAIRKKDERERNESSILSSDELGKFYYPVSLLKLPREEKQVLKPLNAKNGEMYTISASRVLTSEELAFDKNTGELSLYHKNESTTGEVVITVTSSSNYEYTFTVDFLDNEYFNIANFVYATPYWADCPQTTIYDSGSREGSLPAGPLDFFGLDLTLERVAEIFGYDIDKKGEFRFLYINITGFINVEVKNTYTFYIQSDYGSLIELDGNIIVSSYLTCNGSTVELSSEPISLDAGYYSFKYHVISGMQRSGDSGPYGGYGFDFKVKIGNGEKQHVELYNKPSYKAAHSLIFFKSSYSWGKGVEQQIEFTVTEADTCTTIPPLPTGYKIKTGTLSGTSNDVSTNSYSVYCYSSHANTNIFNITIEVTDIFLKGLVAYYMKYDSFPRLQDFLPNRNEEGSHLKVLRIEEIANKEYSPDIVVWKGLGAEFMSEYGVHWEGVIKYPKSGIYSYKLTCDDSCNIKLKSSYEVRAFSYKGNQNSTVTQDIEVYDDELNQYFMLEYTQYKGASTVELLIKGPDDSDYHYPSELLFYNPPSRLEYTYVISSYLIDVAIPVSNKPLFNGITIEESDKPKFSINKDLPQGISFDETTGYIEGLPIVATKRDEYVITATFTKRDPLETTVFISVEDIKAPSNVYIFNELTSDKYYNTGTIALGSVIKFTLSDDSGAAVAGYYLTGELPLSTFDNDKATIEGYATQLGEFALLIQACNGAGCTTSNITITVEDQCKEDEDLALFTLSPTGSSYEFSLVDSTGKSVISAIDIKQPKEKWTKTICLKNAEYTANIWNNLGYYSTFRVEILMNGVVISNVTKYGGGYSGGKAIVRFHATDVPSPITYSTTEMVFEQYIDRTLEASFYNVLSDFKVEPELPEGITISKNNGLLGGMCLKNYPKKVYTVSAVSLSGHTVSLNITIEVVLTKCIDKGYALLHVYAMATGYGRQYVNVEIRDSNNNVTLKIGEYDLDSHYYKCVPQGDYTLKCRTDAAEGQGWNGGYADVFFYEAPMGHCSIKTGDGPHEYTAPLHLSYGVDSSTTWQYSLKYEQGWNKNGFTSVWGSSKLEDIDTSSSNTLYLRKIIPVHDLDSFSAFYTRIDVFTGFVYYVNETEVGRINLPAGQLSDTHKATNRFDAITPVTYVLPISMFNNREVLIAIELHKYDDSDKLNDVKFYSVDLNGDNQESCTRLNTFGIVSDAYPEGSDYTPKRYAMDSNEITYYMGGTGGIVGKPYLTISFGEYKFVYINRFMFVNPSKYMSTDNPLSIDINQKTTEGIKKITTLEIKKPAYDYEIIDTDIYDNNYLTNELQLNMTANPDSSSIIISDFMPGVCNIFYCMKTDILPYTKGGDNITVDCPNGLEGYRTFLCPTGKKPQWREIQNTCPIKPEILTKKEKYSFITGKTEEGVVLFTYTGYIRSMSINPPLPTCIKQQQPYNYGIYNAKCLSEIPLALYTFTLVNDFGSTEVQVSLSVDHSNSPVITSYVTDYTFYVGVKTESAVLFTVIGNELDISVKPPLPQGLTMDGYTGKISGSPLEELENGLFTFTIKNQYDSVGIMIKINVILSESPVVIDKVDSYTFYYGVDYKDLVLYQIAGKSLSYFLSGGDLPKSMKLDGKTGRLYGKVAVKEPSSGIFTITASATTEGTGKIDVTIPFTIEETKKPVVISQKDEYVLNYGDSVESIKLFEDNGLNITYTVNPSLPEGLVLNEKTGEISGTVKTTTGSKYYTFYLRNADGEATIQILLSFTKPIVPVILSYNNYYAFTKNLYIEPTLLFEATARTLKYKCEPELPIGIKFNEMNGLISGTPVSDSKNQTYIFTVYNDQGSVNVSINIEVVIKYCSTDGEWSMTEMGSVNYLGCKGAYSGNKFRKCLPTDTGAVWGGINDDCTIQTGLIVGVIIACVIAVALIVLVVVFCIYRRNAIKKVNADKKRQIIDSKGIHM